MNYSDFDAITVPFFDHSEPDFFINLFGYNNFEYIKPVNQFRTQPFSTLHFVLEGSGTLMVDDKRYKPKEGTMFFIPPRARLCYYPDEDTPWKYFWFEMHGKNALLYAGKMGFSSQNHLMKCKDFTNTKQLFQKLFSRYLKHSSGGYYDTLSFFYKILDSNLQTNQEVTETNIVDEIVNYIQYHYHNANLSVPMICHYFNISHSYLCKLFKDANHCSMKNHIIQVRIRKSCELLKTTSHSIKEIALSVGFTDENHFMKTFKKIMGKTPTQYRKESAKEKIK